jgi:hypothetical protein
MQVRMTVVLDHVLDTVQHLLKKKVALERAVDPDTPDIIADGSRIVQVCIDLALDYVFFMLYKAKHLQQTGHNMRHHNHTVTCSMSSHQSLSFFNIVGARKAYSKAVSCIHAVCMHLSSRVCVAAHLHYLKRR